MLENPHLKGNVIMQSMNNNTTYYEWQDNCVGLQFVYHFRVIFSSPDKQTNKQ